jgi:hypothetical protein
MRAPLLFLLATVAIVTMPAAARRVLRRSN